MRSLPPFKQIANYAEERNAGRFRAVVDYHLPDILRLDFQMIFRETGTYDVELYEPVARPDSPKEGERLPAPITAERVQQLAAETGADLILALELIAIHNVYHEEEKTVTAKNDKGEKIEQVVRSGFNRVDCGATFRFYEPRSGLWIDFDVTTGSDEFIWEEGTIYGARGDERLLCANALREAFESYAKTLTPHYSEVSHTVFVDNRSLYRAQLAEAAELFADPLSWEEAISIWETLLQQEEPGLLKAKVLSNLSIAAHRKGNDKEALRYAIDATEEDASTIFQHRLRWLHRAIDEQGQALRQTE